MTIVGDLAQTSTPAGASSWADVLQSHVDGRWRMAQLSVNYRTPAEIMAATTELFAAHHPGLEPPRPVRSSGVAPWRLRTTLASLPQVVADPGSELGPGLAVITPPRHRNRLTTALSVPLEPDLTRPLVVLTPALAKGLEFAAVLVVDPAEILAEPLGHNDLYVAMTRATQQLGIVHPGPVPAVLSGVADRSHAG